MGLEDPPPLHYWEPIHMHHTTQEAQPHRCLFLHCLPLRSVPALSHAAPGDVQWVKKLSQYLAVSERVVCNKSNKLHKNVKIIYVIV